MDNRPEMERYRRRPYRDAAVSRTLSCHEGPLQVYGSVTATPLLLFSFMIIGQFPLFAMSRLATPNRQYATFLASPTVCEIPAAAAWGRAIAELSEHQ